MVGSIIGGGITLAKFIHDMNEADKNTAMANKMSVKAANTVGEAEAKERANNSKYRNSKNKVVNRKSAVIKSSFPRFMSTYEKIMKIEFFDNTEGIREIFHKSRLDEFNGYMGAFLTFDPPGLTDNQLLSGFVVDGFKGSLIGANFLISGITGSIVKDSELLKTAAHAQKKQAMLYREAVEAKETALEVVCFYMDKISEIISNFNGLFLKSMRVTEGIIDKNGEDGSKYSDKELEKIGVCMNLAVALKDIVDTPIIDEQNEITTAAKKLVETSEYFIKSFANIV